MNLPNKLTALRVIHDSVFCGISAGRSWAGACSQITSPWSSLLWQALTDLLDGKIARKYNLVTNFGKFMDPLADKLLVCSALICLVELGQLPAWMVIIIISREFIISGFRLIASDNGVVIAASYWGKFKTTFQMLMIILLILDLGGVFTTITTIVTWAALILTVVSLVDYLAKNKGILLEGDI